MEALPDLTAQGFRTLLDGVVRSGIAYVGREVPIKLPHHGPAEVEYLNFVYQPLRDAQGRVRGVLSCGFEVTEQVLARKQAQALSAQLEAIFQSFPEPLYVADATGIIRTNAAGLSLLGAKSLEDLNRNITTLHEKVHARWADTGEPIAASDNQLLRALQGYTGFLDFIVRDLSTGKDRVLRSAAAPVWVGEQVVGAVSVNMDFTDRTLAERALRERAEFEQQLIGIVSHDLRNPLNAILLGVQGLLRREELDERGTRALLRIQSSSERAIRMVKDLLDFTQARLGGGIPVHPRPLKLHTFTRQVVEEVRASFPEREIEVEAQGEGEGSWDSDRLAQVVTNLLTNALKYSPEGTPVRVRTRGEGDWVELAVHNGGAPIPPEALGRLFLPLQRATADVDKAGRSVGLGLYIVKQLVEAHRGTIEVKSSAQEGTTFTVRLPRRAE
jgi:signal transduction histidine kinase